MATPLRQLLNEVLFDPDSRSEFASDPGEYLRANGWSNLEGAELEEAVAALGDGLPVETALVLDTVTTSVDFAATDLDDVGGVLAEVATQVDPDLPLHVEGLDSDLAFGSGSLDADPDPLDDDRADNEAFDSGALATDTSDSDTSDNDASDSDAFDIDSFDSGAFDESMTDESMADEPMVGPSDDAGGDRGADVLGLADDDLDFGIDG